MSDVTRILSAIEQGDSQAAEKLLPLVYDELRKLAAAKMAQEKPGQTLQATALVHEAYVRLVDVEQAQHWDSRVSVAVRNWTTVAARTEPAGWLHGGRRRAVAPRDRDAEASAKVLRRCVDAQAVNGCP